VDGEAAGVGEIVTTGGGGINPPPPPPPPNTIPPPPPEFAVTVGAGLATGVGATVATGAAVTLSDPDSREYGLIPTPLVDATFAVYVPVARDEKTSNV